jgi:hypothetical protein
LRTVPSTRSSLMAILLFEEEPDGAEKVPCFLSGQTTLRELHRHRVARRATSEASERR